MGCGKPYEERAELTPLFFFRKILLFLNEVKLKEGLYGYSFYDLGDASNNNLYWSGSD